MTPQRPSLAALLVTAAALTASPARAQGTPAPVAPGPDAPLPVAPIAPVAPAAPPVAPVAPGPDAPLPPSAQPLAPVGPVPYGATPYNVPPYVAPWRGPPPAQVGWTEPDREHVPPANWYGWQTLVAVAPFDIAMFVGLAHYSDPSGAKVFGTAFAARNLVPGVVHFAHGHVGRGFASMGLQAATTATGVAIGYIFGLALQAECPPLNPCRNNFRGIPPEAGYGAIAGSMVGTVLDVVFFAHRQQLSWTAAKNEPSWTLAPFATQRAVGMAAGWEL
jgi:hypothetical protein